MKNLIFIKGISLILTVALLTAVMSGCNNGNSSDSLPLSGSAYDLGGRVVTLASWGDMRSQEGSPEYAQKAALIEELEERYNCKLDFYYTGDYNTYMEAILTTAMSGELIGDVFQGDFDKIVPQWIKNNIVVPIDDYFDFSAEQWNQTENDAWLYEGKHYGITSWIEEPGYMLLFNKNIVEENNISAESLYELQADGAWTWDKLEEYAIKCTRDTNNDGVNDTWGLGAYAHSPFATEAFIYSNGVSPVVRSDDFKYTYNLENPAVIEAMEFGRKLVYQDKVADMSSVEWGYWEALWKRGRIAFYVVPRWVWDSYHEAFEEAGMEYGVLFVPKGPNAEDYVTLANSYAGFFMQPDVEDKEAVGALLSDFLADYSWRKDRDLEYLYQSFVFDDESMETIKMCEGRTVSSKGGNISYFKSNVLWTDWGINQNIPTETFIATHKQPSQAAMDELWSGLEG